MASARSGVIAAAVITTIGAIVVAVITVSSKGSGNGSQNGPIQPTPAITFPLPSASVAEVFLNRDSGPGGTQVLVSGKGFGPGERVVLDFHTDQIGSTTASAQGAFANVAITIPRSYSKFAPQQFDIRAEGQSTLQNGRAPFTITG